MSQTCLLSCLIEGNLMQYMKVAAASIVHEQMTWYALC